VIYTAVEIPLNNTSKVVSITQDYIILGKSTKETEIRINFDGSNYMESKDKLENCLRLAAYAEMIQTGQVLLPKYEPKEKPHIKVEA